MEETETKSNYVAHDKLKTFHLFAGAGGGILADLLLGHVPVGACEIEEYPREVLLQRQRDGILPEFPIWDDIRTLDGYPWREYIDVIAGGFPCQGISAAGKGFGLSDSRSGLWFEMLRVIGEIRPPYVFVENSPKLIIRGLDRILSDLTELGYNSRWGTLSSSETGGEIEGQRIWIIASSMCGRLPTRRNAKLSTPRIVFRETSNKPPGHSKYSRAEKWRRRANASYLYRNRDALAYRNDRLKAIGNGQDPYLAATAWRILTSA